MEALRREADGSGWMADAQQQQRTGAQITSVPSYCHIWTLPSQSEYAELFVHMDVVAGSDFPLAQSLDRKRGVVLFYCCAFFHPGSH